MEGGRWLCDYTHMRASTNEQLARPARLWVSSSKNRVISIKFSSVTSLCTRL